MQTRTDADGSLLLTYDSAGLSAALFVFAVILIATAGYDYFIGPRGTDRLIGIIGGVATCGLSGLMMLERVRIRVDPRTRTIDWTRRWGLRRRSGLVSFDDITAVTTERPLGDDGTPSRRIVVTTRDNRTVPFTVGYHSDADSELIRLADRVRDLIGSGGQPADHLQSLVDAGRTLDAIKYARETRGLSLTDAKSLVDGMKKE